MSEQRTAKQEVAEALEALLGVIEAGDSQCWSLQAKATDRVRAVIKRLRTVDETSDLQCMSCGSNWVARPVSGAPSESFYDTHGDSVAGRGAK